ncbi:MAG: hypothetical protein JWN46_418 [Acidimicrobiales bacterium]|nr:hypothetical protein [Acidimicrobiales bacterium]
MRLERFLTERQPAWAELEQLAGRARGRVQVLSPSDVRRLGDLHRRATADLALARRRFAHDPVVARLEALVARSRALVYGTAVRPASALQFLTTGYWRRVRERPRILAVAALLLWGSALGTGLWAHAHPNQAARVAAVSPLAQNVVDHGGPRRADAPAPSFTVNTALATQIFTNNVKVALVAFAGGLTGGLLTIATTLFNGALVGLLAGWVVRGGGGSSFFRLVLPHGVLELSLFTVASAAGLRAGWALVHPGHRRRIESLATEGRAAVELAVGTAVWLVPCGLVEGFVTPRGLSLPMAATVGVSLAAVFWGMVVWRGRPEPTAATPAGDRPQVTAEPATSA